MARIKISNEWWTAPAQSADGKVIMVTGRAEIDNVRLSRRFNYRVEVSWRYEPDAMGMPDTPTAKAMDAVNEALAEQFRTDPVAVNTGIYTGDGERDWVFYTRSLELFQKGFNRAMSDFDETFPLEFYATEDPEWEEYEEMRQNEILPGED